MEQALVRGSLRDGAAADGVPRHRIAEDLGAAFRS
jgi:hypothetical protein